MRIVRNVGHIKRRKRIARWSAFFGFVALVSTFPIVFIWGESPNLVIIAYFFLFAGFILFNYGMQQIGKWSNTARHQRDDLALDARLSDLPDRYALIHYPRLGKRVVEHLLVHPGGVLVLATRDFPGTVKGRGNRWRRGGVGLTRLFGLSGPQLGNPSLETESGITQVEQTLKEHELEVDVDGAIVFTSPMVVLDVEDPDFAVMEIGDLADYVKGLEVDPSIRNPEREQLVAILSQGEELEAPTITKTRRPVKVKRVKRGAA